MSAAEVIEQIKALPPADQQRVAEFVQSLSGRVEEEGTGEFKVRYASREKVKAVSDKIFSQNAELFRKLAE